MHTYTYTHTHIYTHIYTHIHTHIHTYIHTCIHPYIHTYIHTYIYTYIHTYIKVAHWDPFPSLTVSTASPNHSKRPNYTCLTLSYFSCLSRIPCVIKGECRQGYKGITRKHEDHYTRLLRLVGML